MNSQRDFFQNKQFLSMATFISAVIIVHTAINVFAIGGESFVLTINSYANFVYSSFAAILAIWTWNYTSAKDLSKRIWAGIALGLSLWAIADVISALYPLLLGQDIPDLSMADVFWLVGYLPLTIALLWRFRSFGIKPTKRQMNIAIALMVVTVLVSGYFVVWPAIQSADPDDFWASLVNVLYPMGDALIATVSLFILFTLGKGSFSSVWQVIAMGLVLRSFGDLMYNYAAGNDLYWPNNHLTPATILTDIPYSVSSLAIALGIYMQRVLSRYQAAQKTDAYFESGTLTRTVGNTDILVFTDAQGKIAFLSNNFKNLVKTQDKSQFIGASLKYTLGLSLDAQNTLLEDIRHLGYVRNRPLQITTKTGALIQVHITAAASKNEELFTGTDIVLRANIEDNAPDEETASLAKQIYLRAGVRHTENLQVAKDYVKARILRLQALLQRLSGEKVARSMLNLFNQTAQEHNWHYKMDGENVFFPEDETEEQMAKALPILVRTVTQYAENVAGYQVIESEISLLEEKIAPGTLRILDIFGVR
jgi:hypothetical protein